MPLEHVFNSGGFIVDPYHARLLQSNVNILLFLSKNMS